MSRLKKMTLIMFFLLVTTIDFLAKPAYCHEALANCKYECTSTYDTVDAYTLLMKTGCLIGCGIGYNSCGE
jgi:hypothetical protein